MDNSVLTFNPIVRFACRTKNAKDYDDFLYAYDYRIFYITEGKVRVVFLDSDVTLSNGDLIIIPPKVGYKLKFFGKYAYYYILNFDITNGKAGVSETPPVKKQDFRESKVISYMPNGYDTPLTFFTVTTVNDEFIKINQEFNLNAVGRVEVASSLLKVILIKLLQNKDFKGDKTSPWARAKAYIDANWFKTVSNQTVAKQLGYHPYYLGTLFKKHYGVTLHDYIVSVKLVKAKAKLLETSKPISEIAFEVGFLNPSYFSETFKSSYGYTPNDYRKNVK